MESVLGLITMLSMFTSPFVSLPCVLGNCVCEERNGWNGMPEDIEGMFVEIATSAGEGLNGLEALILCLRGAFGVGCDERFT